MKTFMENQNFSKKKDHYFKTVIRKISKQIFLILFTSMFSFGIILQSCSVELQIPSKLNHRKTKETVEKDSLLKKESMVNPNDKILNSPKKATSFWQNLKDFPFSTIILKFLDFLIEWKGIIMMSLAFIFRRRFKALWLFLRKNMDKLI